MTFVTLAIGTDSWSAVAPTRPTPWTNTADSPVVGNGRLGGVPGNVVRDGTSETSEGRYTGRGVAGLSAAIFAGCRGPELPERARRRHHRQREHGEYEDHRNGPPAAQLAPSPVLVRRQVLGPTGARTDRLYRFARGRRAVAFGLHDVAHAGPSVEARARPAPRQSSGRRAAWTPRRGRRRRASREGPSAGRPEQSRPGAFAEAWTSSLAVTARPAPLPACEVLVVVILHRFTAGTAEYSLAFDPST